MKSLSVRVLGLIFIGLSIFTNAEVRGEDWKYIGGGGNWTFWWYDAQGVTNYPDRIIQVWVKKMKVDENEIKGASVGGAKLTLSKLEQITSGKDYERCLMEIECVKKTISMRQKYTYDSKGILKSGESKRGAKQSIPTDSVAEKLYEILCK